MDECIIVRTRNRLRGNRQFGHLLFDPIFHARHAGSASLYVKELTLEHQEEIEIGWNKRSIPGPIRIPLERFGRYFFAGLIVTTALFGIGMLFELIRDDGITGLEIVILALFTWTS